MIWECQWNKSVIWECQWNKSVIWECQWNKSVIWECQWNAVGADDGALACTQMRRGFEPGVGLDVSVGGADAQLKIVTFGAGGHLAFEPHVKDLQLHEDLGHVTAAAQRPYRAFLGRDEADRHVAVLAVLLQGAWWIDKGNAVVILGVWT